MISFILHTKYFWKYRIIQVFRRLSTVLHYLFWTSQFVLLKKSSEISHAYLQKQVQYRNAFYTRGSRWSSVIHRNFLFTFRFVQVNTWTNLNNISAYQYTIAHKNICKFKSLDSCFVLFLIISILLVTHYSAIKIVISALTPYYCTVPFHTWLLTPKEVEINKKLK